MESGGQARRKIFRIRRAASMRGREDLLCEPIQLIGQLPGVSKGEHISRHSPAVETVTSPLAATPIFFWTSRITELNPMRSSAEEGVSLRAICGFFRASVRTRCRSDRPMGFVR